jgi:hypothetical protein
MAEVDRRTKIFILRRISSKLPQPIIFRGLQHYHYSDRELSLALFEYGGALFSLMPGGEAQLGYEARNFCPTDEQIESFQRSAEEYGFDRDHPLLPRKRHYTASQGDCRN